MEQFYIPARRLWIPGPLFENVVESFDQKQRRVQWKWGNVTKEYVYDDKGKDSNNKYKTVAKANLI